MSEIRSLRQTTEEGRTYIFICYSFSPEYLTYMTKAGNQAELRGTDDHPLVAGRISPRTAGELRRQNVLDIQSQRSQ